MVVELSQSQEGDVLVLSLEGRLDAAAAPLLERSINALMDEGNKSLLFNFSKVEYISSAGMRLLLAVCKRLQASQGQMVLSDATNEVMEVIKMAGFDHVLDIAPDQADGLTRFKG